MKFVFGVDHTRHGCTVWMDGPSGHRYKARFRNTYQCQALTKAESWVWEKRQSLLESSQESGKQLEFEIPPELDRVSCTKHIAQPVDWWIAFEEQARAEGISLSAWLGEAARAKLPPNVAKKLSERPPANRPPKAKRLDVDEVVARKEDKLLFQAGTTINRSSDASERV